VLGEFPPAIESLALRLLDWAVLGRREWRVRTSLREVSLSVGPGRVGETTWEERRLLLELLLELERPSTDLGRTMRDVLRALRGGEGALPFPAPEPALDRGAARSRLERALTDGELSLKELIPTPVHLLPSAAEEAPESAVAGEMTFIEVAVRDDDDKPVSGRRVRIRFPDGAVREGYTDVGGRFRCDDLAVGGTASVTLPEYDADGYPLASDEA
jgi:hypothetical protein